MIITPRERVIKSLNFKQPDRVPMALGGSAYGVTDELYFKILKLMGIGEVTKPFRKNYSINYYDERILDRIGTDTRYVWIEPIRRIPCAKNGEYIDEWGLIWKKAGPYFSVINAPLKGMSYEEIKNYSWPNTFESFRFESLSRMIEDKRKLYAGRYAISLRSVTSHGLFQLACDLRGTEDFLMDLATNKSIVFLIIEKIHEIISKLIESALDASLDAVDIVELPGDDFASQSSLIISPKAFEEFFLTPYKEIVGCIKAKVKNKVYVLFHSDGYMKDLLDFLVEIGVDIFHPLEPLPVYSIDDLISIKKKYQGRLAFLGAVDIKKSLSGRLAKTKEEVKKSIDIFFNEGGYILAPANHLQADVNEENVVFMYEFARKYSREKVKSKYDN